MKNLSLILNIVLLVAVGVLFYFQFKPNSTSVSTGSSVNAGDLSIAYINTDSVLKHYEYLKTNTKTLEDKRSKMEQDLRNRATALQNEIGAFQRNVNNMTFGQQKAVEEDLTKKQQNFQMYQQTLEQQFSMEGAKLQKELYERITAYLKKYGAEKGLQVVLKYDTGSDLLFGVEGLDISKDVIAGLNAEYAAEKTGGVKADTTATTK